MEKFETYLCPLCYSKHTDKCSKIEWTSSLSPKQEWRLHNGECDVPEWFLIWSERVYTDAVSNREKEIAEEVEKYALYCQKESAEQLERENVMLAYDMDSRQVAAKKILQILKH